MKARKFWAIYIPLVALGLVSFFILSSSLQGVPLALSDIEMGEISGRLVVLNSKCVDRSPCYPNRTGCDTQNAMRYTSLGKWWEGCDNYTGKKCNLNTTIRDRTCYVTYYTGPGCNGESGGYTRWNTIYCDTSSM